MIFSNEWSEYELLNTGDGEKLERWGEFHLQRPDGQIIWPHIKILKDPQIDAIYHRSDKGGGNWEFRRDLPKRWVISYKDLKFYVEPTGFKHMGLFPEQAVNWDWSKKLIKNAILESNRKLNVLNLFAYTGAASIACASVGADVVHVDSSKGMNEWAKENYELNFRQVAESKSHTQKGNVRFITDDVKKFVQREIRRGNKYDAIIMDPPVYGRGPKGELWEIEKEISSLVKSCVELLDEKSIFFLVNTYTASISPIALSNLLNISIVSKYKGKVENGEIGLPISNTTFVLPCGIYARWEK